MSPVTRGSVAALDSPAVRVGVPRETANGEQRVALVPESVPKLTALGLDVVVERGAGHEASFTDEAYAEAGAQLVESALDADLVVKVAPPSASEAEALREGAVLVGFLAPLTDPEGIERLRERGVTAFAMESIPRIT